MRRLHHRYRRHVGEELHHVRRAGAGLRDHHDRGRRQRRRHAVGAAGRFPHDARAAMRLLHAGHDPAGATAAAGEPHAQRGRDPHGHLRQHLPLHRLPEHRQGDPVRAPPRSTAPNSRRPPNERHDSHAGTARSKTGRHGLQAQARRGRALHPGQGQLCRRPEAAGHAAWRFRPLAARPCPRHFDQFGERPESARRAGGDHRRDAEDRQPRLDADAGRRRADGAGRRQGAVPEPGSGVRGRHRPLRRR